MLKGSEIRRKFLDFFVQKGHREVHSSSLVPHNDPTLLFTNAGMNQFKDVFLGLEKRDYNRATSSQKCVRAGGKHNDLENVGFTNRHHTFFEMLGNFSFGDYFKKDAIAYAWELITSEKWFGIDKSKLYVTIFNGEGGVAPRDSEAHDLWLGRGVLKGRIFESGFKDNFWQMGDTGPCGPCSEIHYDMGPAASDQGHADCKFPCDCGRYVEIWNLVFMQFDRDSSGKLNPLPKPSIDTGMGLERITAVLQGVISNYETDLFVPLIEKAAELTGTSLKKELNKEAHTKSAASLRVIADHSRAATFLISDGVLPSNEGRGYVLRKIIRRAITHGRLLGQTDPFLHEMVLSVSDGMKDAYPELLDRNAEVIRVIQAEEARFSRTVDAGLRRLEEIIRGAKEKHHQEVTKYFDGLDAVTRGRTSPLFKKWLEGDSAGEAELFRKIIDDLTPFGVIPLFAGLRDRARAKPLLNGDEVFRLYDTYGLPLDFIQDMARDQGVLVDQQGFENALQNQREKAKASWKGVARKTPSPAYKELAPSIFEGYTGTRSQNCQVLALMHEGRSVFELRAREEGEVILDHTPFYAESGGQVGDRGWIVAPGHHLPNLSPSVRIDYFGYQISPYLLAEVKGCYYPVQGVRAHQVIAKQAIRVGDKVDAVVDTGIREATMRNHTATHLLQAGLREVLGKHVKQAGSLVAPNHLRFDFSHFTAVEDEELQDIEDLINKEVLQNEKVEVINDVPIDVAVNEYHAMALFGEKYGDKVRVIKIGDFSTELCGGTHTGATGEIGLIKILKEGSVSSGVRRVEAVTGEGSLRHFRKDHELEEVVSKFVVPTFRQNRAKDGAPTSDDGKESKSPPSAKNAEGWGTHDYSPADALKAELEKKDAEIKRLARELDQARMKQASSSTANISEKIKDVRGVKVLAHRVDNLERPQMRTLVDQLRDKIGSGVVVLGSATDGSVSLIVGVTKDLTGKIQAGKVIAPVAQKVGGKGGGRPDLAEAGGKDPAALDAALGEAYSVVESLLG